MGLNINSSMKINGAYKIHHMVSEGNYSEIYRVTDSLGSEYAAKFVSEGCFCFLENESKVMPYVGGLHPGMPYWYYLGIHGEHFVLVMDLFSHSIRSIRNQYRSLSLQTSLLLCIQMVTCIESVHDKGFIHCDINPDKFVIGKY